MVKLGALAFGLLTVVAQVSAQTTVKVMPFGASIVSRCWRANLQTKLRNDGITNFDFVGTQKSTCGGANIDQDHEGHPGSLATDYAAKGNLTVWLNAVDTPDIILMLLGTNDVLIGKKPVGDVLKAYDVLIDQMRAKNPKIRLIFSNLLPLDPDRWPKDGAAGIVTLNTAIRQYAPSKNTRNSPVVFVDNFTGFNPVADTTDGEHPNDSGNEKMASKFFGPTRDAIKAISDSSSSNSGNGRLVPAQADLNGTPTPTPVPSAQNTQSPTKPAVPAVAQTTPSSAAPSSAAPPSSAPPSSSTAPSRASSLSRVPSQSQSQTQHTSSPSSSSSSSDSTASSPSTSPSPLASSAQRLSLPWPLRFLASLRAVLSLR